MTSTEKKDQLREGEANDEQQQAKIEADFEQFLSTEEPKIDAALKSFASWTIANYGNNSNSIASSDNAGAAATTALFQQQQHARKEILRMVRILSQTINRHVFPAFPSSSSSSSSRLIPRRRPLPQRKDWQYAVAARVWNGRMAIHQKPTKSFGRTALMLAWNDLDWTEQWEQEEWLLPEESDFFRKEFERLLFSTSSSSSNEDNSCDGGIDKDDDDARLVWQLPEKELARRAEARKTQATRRLEQEEADREELTRQQQEIVQELLQG